MKASDLKYLLAYLLPILTFLAIAQGGLLSYTTVIFAFVLIPIIDQMYYDTANHSDDQVEVRQLDKLFDVLLHLNVPFVFGNIIFLLYALSSTTYATYEIVGLILSVGTMLGSNAINVAHELGHRSERHHQWSAKILLLSSLYTHFTIEHNRGHHVHIATPEDPATSRKGELVYAFWFRSTVGSYINSWKLEHKRLKGKSLSRSNEMIFNTGLTAVWIGALIAWVGFTITLIYAASAIVGILLLESINYIEHYGLQRKKKANGRYEQVREYHSWNSDHVLGRIMLYELTRHSDHHFRANKEYQILEHHGNAPQLPFGYPLSILVALVPPLWFVVMDKQLAKQLQPEFNK